jgi:hypothetical protein
MKFQSHSRSSRISITAGTRFDRRLRLHPLVTGLALVFAAAAPAAGGDTSHTSVQAVRSIGSRHAAPFALDPAVTSATSFTVNTCDDPLPLPATCPDNTTEGTLRLGLLCAQGGTIDLAQLKCSKITLSAPLTTPPITLALAGPADGQLTIDAGGKFRALVHKPPLYNNGPSPETLYINNLTIANGRYDNPGTFAGYALGGCIYSTGNVFLDHATVSSCLVSSPVRFSILGGGAIYAKGTVSLDNSRVTDSKALGDNSGTGGASSSYGGGIYARIIVLNRSTVSGNTASSAGASAGGGVLGVTVYASYSTVSGNQARTGAGLYVRRAYLTDSTISGNHTPSDGLIGGVYARDVMDVSSCTIAGNTSGGTLAAGLFSGYSSPHLKNTIVANNTADGIEFDAGTAKGRAVLGSNNLIMVAKATTAVPIDTISADPLLGPLRDNGGATRTQALLPGSPALDKGGNTGLSFDQRDLPRVTGNKLDIGAVEFDPDSIFDNSFDL